MGFFLVFLFCWFFLCVCVCHAPAISFLPLTSPLSSQALNYLSFSVLCKICFQLFSSLNHNSLAAFSSVGSRAPMCLTEFGTIALNFTVSLSDMKKGFQMKVCHFPPTLLDGLLKHRTSIHRPSLTVIR